MQNPFKSLCLADGLLAKGMGDEARNLRSTDTYRKYLYMAEVMKKSFALSLLFWSTTIGFLIVSGLTLSVGGDGIGYVIILFLHWLALSVVQVMFNQNQTEDFYKEAYAASKAISMALNSSTEEIIGKLTDVAELISVGERRGMLTTSDYRRWMKVTYSVAKAAGHKVGEYNSYFKRD